MTDLEIRATGEVLRINYSFNPVILYGVGAISFRHVMITFLPHDTVLIKGRRFPCETPEDLLKVLTEFNLIRSKAVKQLTFNINKQLNTLENEK